MLECIYEPEKEDGVLEEDKDQSDDQKQSFPDVLQDRQLFLKLLQYSQDITCTGVSF